MSEYTAHLDLVLDLRAPAAARRLVSTLLQQWGVTDDDLLDAASIVVSELVSNALRHSDDGGPVELQVLRHQEHVRIALADGSAVVPRPRSVDGDSEHGRGLAIIEQLTNRWGVEDYRGGKRVYADLRLDDA